MPDKVADIDAYIATLPPEGRAFAERIRAIVREAVPEAGEAIKYGMPAFQIAGRSFLYFAMWKKHAGVYPVYRGDDAFEAKLAAYRAGKDTVQFRFAAPLPEALLAEIARAQADRS